MKLFWDIKLALLSKYQAQDRENELTALGYYLPSLLIYVVMEYFAVLFICKKADYAGRFFKVNLQII